MILADAAVAGFAQGRQKIIDTVSQPLYSMHVNVAWGESSNKKKPSW